jgi:hypothetical protein
LGTTAAAHDGRKLPFSQPPDPSPLLPPHDSPPLLPLLP